MNDFSFTQKERSEISGRLSAHRWANSTAEQFIDALQREVSEWRQEWPQEKIPPLESRRNALGRLADHLHKVRLDIELLPESIDPLLWIRFQRNQLPEGIDGGSTPAEWNRLRRETLAFLLDLQRAAGDLQGEIGISGGADTLRKVRLVESIARIYFLVFRRRPSCTPGGTFFAIVKNTEAVLARRGLQIVIGKDVVARAISNCESLFDVVRRNGR